MMILQDFLLVFWQTAIVVACRHQAEIIAIGNNVEWRSEKMRQWFSDLLKRYESGNLSREDSFFVQHDQLIFEQLGMPERADESTRWTLRHLLKSLFASNAEEAYNLCEKNLRVHLHYLVASSHASDLYLNAVFGIVLHKNIFENQAAIYYDKDSRYRIVDVHLIRGRVVNSVYCSTICALNSASNVEKNQTHSESCKNRHASWLLLTIANEKNTKDIRQVHIDVASIAYGIKTFFGSIPVPCNIGFIPHLTKSALDTLEKVDWRHVLAKHPAYEKPPPTDQPYYLIDRVACIYNIQEHKKMLQESVKNLENNIKPLRASALISQRLEQCLSKSGEELSSIALLSFLQKKNISVQEASENYTKMQQIIASFTEAENANYFFENLFHFDEIAKQIKRTD